jgi:hypothetical protein
VPPGKDPREAFLSELADQLRFQVSLLKLCAPQERSMRPGPATGTRQLEELANLVPVRSR